jgi:hypothetical protein
VRGPNDRLAPSRLPQGHDVGADVGGGTMGPRRRELPRRERYFPSRASIPSSSPPSPPSPVVPRHRPTPHRTHRQFRKEYSMGSRCVTTVPQTHVPSSPAPRRSLGRRRGWTWWRACSGGGNWRVRVRLWSGLRVRRGRDLRISRRWIRWSLWIYFVSC